MNEPRYENSGKVVCLVNWGVILQNALNSMHIYLSSNFVLFCLFHQSLMDQYFARMCSLMLSKELPARIRFLLQVRFLTMSNKIEFFLWNSKIKCILF